MIYCNNRDSDVMRTTANLTTQLKSITFHYMCCQLLHKLMKVWLNYVVNDLPLKHQHQLICKPAEMTSKNKCLQTKFVLCEVFALGFHTCLRGETRWISMAFVCITFLNPLRKYDHRQSTIYLLLNIPESHFQKLFLRKGSLSTSTINWLWPNDALLPYTTSP